MSTWENSPGARDVESNMIEAQAAAPMDDFSGNLYIDMYSWDNMTPLKTWKVPFRVNNPVFYKPKGKVAQFLLTAT